MIVFKHCAMDNKSKTAFTILHEKQPGGQAPCTRSPGREKQLYAINSLYLVYNAHNHISTCRRSYQAPILMLPTRKFATRQTMTS
jgi:hypothetical protein